MCTDDGFLSEPIASWRPDVGAMELPPPCADDSKKAREIPATQEALVYLCFI